MRRFLSVGTVLLAVTCALPAISQTSIGFSEPDDISNLLDYRLPKWGYHIWDADFGLGGNGRDMSRAGVSQIANRFSTNLGTNYNYNRESEQKIYGFGGGVSGRYQHSHQGESTRETSTHSLDGSYNLNGSIKQYLGEGPFSVLAGLDAGRFYSENKTSSQINGIFNEVDQYYRSSHHAYDVGIGVGRQRNVVPLIRAERLSERLATLGRGRLAPFQVQKVAAVLAQEYGYRRVFDRYDRHFWTEVIEPMLADAAPLTTFEIFYLTDVMNEDVGLRFQGWQVSAQFEYRDGSSDGPYPEVKSRFRSPMAALSWYHNLTLNTQLHFAGTWRYTFDNWADRSGEYGRLDVRLGHLWNLADRHLLENVIMLGGDSNIREDTRYRQINYRLNLTTYFEDRLSLETQLGAHYTWQRVDGDILDGWSWEYGIFLRYHLDRVLF